LDFHVSSFWLEIAILEAKFDIFGVNRGQMLKIKIKYFKPQKAHPCVIPLILSHHTSKSVKGLISARASEK